MKQLVQLSVMIMLLSGMATAQFELTRAVRKAEMKKVEQLVGTWKGVSSIGDGTKRTDYTLTKKVSKKLDGLALLFESASLDPDNKYTESLQLLRPNEKLTGFEMATFQDNGLTSSNEWKAVGDHFQWTMGFSSLGLTLRRNIWITNATWIEIGDTTNDGGQTWKKDYETKLTRVN